MMIEHEGRRFVWAYDSRRGYGQFLARDGGEGGKNWCSDLIAGDDCTALRRDLNRLHSKTSGKRYPAAAPRFAELLDSMASEYVHTNAGSNRA